MDGEKEKEKVVLQKPIRTYESDLAETLARKSVSVATIAIAEDRKRTDPETIEKTPKTRNIREIVLVVFSIIFILGGTVGSYFLYLKSPFATVNIEPVVSIPSIISADFQIPISINNSEGDQFIKSIIKESYSKIIENNKIVEFIPSIKSESAQGEIVALRITGSQFINKMGFNMTDVLKRSLTDKWMFGIYEIEDQKLPFIIFTTDFFQNAFAGMLKWETDMPDDLAYILNYKEKTRVNDTVSTTSISSYISTRGNFFDRKVQNRDVREFINERGELLFLYSFINKDIIAIATSEATLNVLIDHIEKQTFVR
ncbi:MAG: hypothetical protein AAB637_00395 [Patescibacteria group bacterium]